MLTYRKKKVCSFTPGLAIFLIVKQLCGLSLTEAFTYHLGQSVQIPASSVASNLILQAHAVHIIFERNIKKISNVLAESRDAGFTVYGIVSK